MSVLTDPATYGIRNSELANCPRTAAVLGELAAQWHKMMGTLQRVEQEAVSSQNIANAIENIGRTRTDATVSRLRLKEGERLYPKSWSGGTPIGGFPREVAAWLGYVDPKHEAGKLIQRITKGTLRATEAWTDGRYAEDDKHVKLDYEPAVALANAAEGAARATVLRITQTEPSRWFVASVGRRSRAQVVERPGDSAAAYTCDAQEVQGCEGVEGMAYSVVIESG